MTAGASADSEARRQQLLVAAYERAADDARRKAASFGVAGQTERQTSQALAPLVAMGYHQLPDRAWPGTRANIDLILVGPSGVYVIDTKAWADVSVQDGRLYRGQLDCQDDLDKLLRVTDLVEAAVADVGLPPLEVVPVVAFAGRKDVAEQLGRVHLQGERSLLAFCARRGQRLTDAQVEELLVKLVATFPPYGVAPEDVSVRAPELPAMRDPVLPAPAVPAQAALDGLEDVADLQRAVLDAALAEPIEEWMTFLHPDQAKAVRRSWSGPARVRGAAGTGKTVLGLHRAAYLTATRPGKVLYVAYVRTLPVVLSALYQRMSPGSADRVEFTGLHKWAMGLLRDRNVPCRLDGRAVDRAYAAAWTAVGKGSALSRLDVPWKYWQEEIDHVIKGRGLTSFEQYLPLVRVGRRTRIGPEHRRAMWDLFCEYERQLAELGVHDFNDVLLLALQEARRDKPGPYVAVVVDEVQDLNLLGVRLLHTLVGDAPDGLLLIGDGQQSVYPGGFTLAEAGIAVTGRSIVLRVNYRNTRQILQKASEVVAGDRFQDLEALDEAAPVDLEVARTGPMPITVRATERRSHDTALREIVAETVRQLGVTYGDLAVLTSTKARAKEYRGVLAGWGVPVVDLEDYDGQSTDRVKVGTVKRAKGLEFKYVFLPLLEDGPSTRWVEETESAHRERVERERRELFVAMTRARDGLWLGFLG